MDIIKDHVSDYDELARKCSVTAAMKAILAFEALEAWGKRFICKEKTNESISFQRS